MKDEFLPSPKHVHKNLFSHPDNYAKLFLNIPVKATHDTIGEDALIPPRPVFEKSLRSHIVNTNLSAQMTIIEAIKSAQAEMNAMITEKNIRSALSYDIPSAADQFINLKGRF